MEIEIKKMRDRAQHTLKNCYGENRRILAEDLLRALDTLEKCVEQRNENVDAAAKTTALFSPSLKTAYDSELSKVLRGEK